MLNEAECIGASAEGLKESIAADGRTFAKSCNVIAIQVLLCSDILYSSRIYRIFGEVNVQPIILGLMSSIIIAYAVFAVVKGWMIPVLLVVGVVGLIFLQTIHFAKLTCTELVINSGFQFIQAATFIVFLVLSKCGYRGYLVSALTIYASAYCALYALLAIAFTMGIASASTLSPMILLDVERGERLFIYAGAAAFAWFYWVTQWRSLIGCVLLAVSGTAILLSQSRVFLVCAASMTLLYMLDLQTKTIRRCCLLILAIVSAGYIVAILDESVNPFAVFAGDSSGDFRSLELSIARPILLANPIQGLGIASSSEIVGQLTGNAYFAASDLGAIGAWWDFGLIGLLLLAAGSYVACLPVTVNYERVHWPLFLMGCTIAINACIAPTIFYASGATYFSLLLGFWLDKKGLDACYPKGKRVI